MKKGDLIGMDGLVELDEGAHVILRYDGNGIATVTENHYDADVGASLGLDVGDVVDICGWVFKDAGNNWLDEIAWEVV